MARQTCDGWVTTLLGQRVLFTGKTRIGGERRTKVELARDVRARGGTPITGTRNATVTVLVQGDLSSAQVTDPVRVRSQSGVYVDEQRRRGNHICIVDSSGITAMLRGEAAPCLGSRTVGADVLELSPAHVVENEPDPDEAAAPLPTDHREPTGRSQGHQMDQELKGELEEEAQQRLMSHYRERGWDVKDTRHGNPFDAIATKDGQTLYLEAKGTTTDGASVILTRGEVDHARQNPGDCVLGIVYMIEVNADRCVVAGSGRFRVIEGWNPDAGALRPRQYDYRPPPPE